MDTNRPIQFQKRRQLFVSRHDETPSVTAMRVCNPHIDDLTNEHYSQVVAFSALGRAGTGE
jgi:hypothetical protein